MKIVTTGDLVIEEQENGYAHGAILIDGNPLDDTILGMITDDTILQADIKHLGHAIVIIEIPGDDNDS